MKKITLLACYLIRKRNLCPGDAKCLVAFNRREGEFERYKGEEVAIVGIVDCGECEGNRNRAVLSLGLLKGALVPLNESVDAIHVGTCVMGFCPRKDDILKALKEKAGVEVVEGGHRYVPPTIF
ncbi:MAG: CGGC domain-containing protein [Bacillota bacterium]|jgi:predicted metal-binding protein|nr:CGGC domain-containing protein [Thermoanaerobacteraceae bacterium]